MTPTKIEQIVEYIPYLEKLSRFLCENDTDAEDLLQDTLLKALSSPYDERGYLKAWLSIIMKHAFFGLKKTKVRNMVDYTPDYSGCNIPIHNTHILSDLISQDLHDDISKLSQVEEAVIRLRIWGYKYDEIVNIMGFNMSKVKSILYKAKIKLNQKWK